MAAQRAFRIIKYRTGRVLIAAAMFLSVLNPAATAVSMDEPSARNSVLARLHDIVPEFTRVDDSLYRGGQPPDEAFALLKELGIRTVISFRHEEEIIEQERVRVEGLGMHYISLPWRIQFQPRQNVILEFLRTVSQKDKGPFFMHCRRGAERSGVADVFYRYYMMNHSLRESWTQAMGGHHLLLHWLPFTAKRTLDFFVRLRSRQHVQQLIKAA